MILFCLQEPKLEAGQPSISAFMYRPIQHIKELFQVLQEIYSNTQSDGADHFTLTQVVDGRFSHPHWHASDSNTQVFSNPLVESLPIAWSIRFIFYKYISDANIIIIKRFKKKTI